MCHQDSWSSRSTLSSQVGTRVSGWLSHGHVTFRLPLPPFLTLFHSVSLFHTFHPTVADTCLRNASDRCLSRSASQLHLGHLFNLRQRDAPPPPISFSAPPSRAAPWLFSSTRSVSLAELLSCCSVVCVLSVSRPLMCLFPLLTLALSLSLQNSVRQQRLAPFHSIIITQRQFDPFDE